ncbi:MAG: hypothetical protein VW268_14205 [Rhodospirillaceae bacterium]
MHPHGDEIVFCVSGCMVLQKETPDGKRSKVTLAAGEYAVNTAGVWHIADIDEPTTAMFITTGYETQYRPR